MEEYSIVRRIATIKKWGSTSLELNVVKWGDSPEKYDLRRWCDNKPGRGITLTEEDLEGLFSVIAEELGYVIENYVGEETAILPKEHAYIPNPVVKLDMNTIIVRSNSFFCNLNHNVKDIKGYISVVDKNGNYQDILVPLAFCEKCETYYILEETYKDLKRRGVACGIFMTKNEYAEYMDLDTTYWKDKSPLRICGYSVSKAEGLTQKQRWAILERIVDTGVMTLDRELSYLDFFIRMRPNDECTYCWEQDRKHMQDYVTKYSGHVWLD